MNGSWAVDPIIGKNEVPSPTLPRQNSNQATVIILLIRCLPSCAGAQILCKVSTMMFAVNVTCSQVDRKLGATIDSSHDSTVRRPAAARMAAVVRTAALDHMAVAVRMVAVTGKFLNSLSYTASWCIAVASGSQLFPPAIGCSPFAVRWSGAVCRFPFSVLSR